MSKKMSKKMNKKIENKESKEYFTFFKNQIDYINKLEKKDKIPLPLYTTTDVGYEMNEKLRDDKALNNNESFLFVKLKKIFDNIPPIDYDIILYRGIKDRKFLDDEDYEPKKNEKLLINPEFEKYKNTFVSTTTKLKVATDTNFLGKNGCCIICIKVKAGSKVLPLKQFNALEEFEVLLKPNGIWTTKMIDAVEGGVFITYVEYDDGEFKIPRLNKKIELDKDMTKESEEYLEKYFSESF